MLAVSTLIWGTVFAQIPKVTRFDQFTYVVQSRDRSRQIAIFNDSDSTWRGRSRIMLLDTGTNREVATLRHGICDYLGYDDFPEVADTLTLMCDDSADPSGSSKTREIAILTLDVKTGQVLRWFAMGGKRHSMWFGPMFFGYWDDAQAMPMHKRATCPDVEPAFDPEAVSRTGIDRWTLPPTLFVVSRRDRPQEFTRWELWMIGPTTSEKPRRLLALPGNPSMAIVCGDGSDSATVPWRFLYVSHVINPFTKALFGDSGFRRGREGHVDVIDLATEQAVVK